MYLQHFGYLEDVDVLVDVEVVLLDEQDAAAGQHIGGPLQLEAYVALRAFLEDHKAQCVVAGKASHVLTVPILLEF